MQACVLKNVMLLNANLSPKTESEMSILKDTLLDHANPINDPIKRCKKRIGSNKKDEWIILNVNDVDSGKN